MMSDPVAKICLMLAAGTERPNDLLKFARWMQMASPDDFVDCIMSIRNSAEIAITPHVRADQRYVSSSIRPSRFSDTIQRVEQLLIDDADLTRAAAAELISKRLARDTQNSDAVPEYKRISFQAWLSKVLNVFPESVILHVATLIRDELIDSRGPVSDWSLTRDSK